MTDDEPSFPALDHALLEALSRVPDEVLRARVAPGSGHGLGDVCGVELDRRAAVREVSAVTDVEGALMVTTLYRLAGRSPSSTEAIEFWLGVDSAERLRTIRAYRAYETDPAFRVRVHVVRYGAPFCGKPGLPGRWGDGDSWVSIDARELATCEACVSRSAP